MITQCCYYLYHCIELMTTSKYGDDLIQCTFKYITCRNQAAEDKERKRREESERRGEIYMNKERSRGDRTDTGKDREFLTYRVPIYHSWGCKYESLDHVTAYFKRPDSYPSLSYRVQPNDLDMYSDHTQLTFKAEVGFGKVYYMLYGKIWPSKIAPRKVSQTNRISKFNLGPYT